MFARKVGDDIRWRHSVTTFGEPTGTARVNEACKEANNHANMPCLALASLTMKWMRSETLMSNSSVRPNSTNSSLKDCNSQSERGLPRLLYSIRGKKVLYSNRTCLSGSSGLDRRICPKSFNLRFNQIWEKRRIDKWCHIIHEIHCDQNMHKNEKGYERPPGGLALDVTGQCIDFTHGCGVQNARSILNCGQGCGFHQFHYLRLHVPSYRLNMFKRC